MKMIYRRLACVALLVFGTCVRAFGDGDIGDLAAARERSLSQTTFTWERDHVETQNGVDPAGVAKDIRQATEEAKAEAAKEHITQSSAIKDMIDSYVNLVTNGDRPSQFEAKDDLVFQCDRDSLVVFGKIQHTESLVGSYHQYMIGNNTVLVADSLSKGGARLEGCPSATVYGTSTPGFRHETPLSAGFDLLPADFSMLTGKNPLLIDGENYRLINDGPDFAIYGGDLPIQSVIKFRIQILFDKKLRAFTEISTYEGKSDRPYQDWKAHDFIGILGVQVPRKIDYTLASNWGKLQTSWTLLNTTTSKPIELSMPLKTPVSDYRLFGPNVKLTDTEVDSQQAETLAKKIDYDWRGRLPSYDELKNLQRLQYPNTTGSGKTTIPGAFWGPVACVAAGFALVLLRPTRRART